MVGHTPYKDRHVVQQIGRSFDIDSGQSTYAIIETDGAVKFKSIEFVDGEWRETPAAIVNIDYYIATRAQNKNPEFFK